MKCLALLGFLSISTDCHELENTSVYNYRLPLTRDEKPVTQPLSSVSGYKLPANFQIKNRFENHAQL